MPTQECNCADPFPVMAFRQDCEDATLGSSALTIGTGPVFLWSCLCFLHCSVHFLNHHTWDSLRKGTLCIKDTVNGAQVAKRSHNKI